MKPSFSRSQSLLIFFLLFFTGQTLSDVTTQNLGVLSQELSSVCSINSIGSAPFLLNPNIPKVLEFLKGSVCRN